MLISKKNGFSMMEIMVVIVIMAITSSIALPKMMKMRENAYKNRANELANKLNGAVSVYSSTIGPFDVAEDRSSTDEEFVLDELRFDPRTVTPAPGSAPRPFTASDMGRPYIGSDWQPNFGGNGTNLYRLIWRSGQFIATNDPALGDGAIIDFNAKDKIK